jgi:hypothetical protein
VSNTQKDSSLLLLLAIVAFTVGAAVAMLPVIEAVSGYLLRLPDRHLVHCRGGGADDCGMITAFITDRTYFAKFVRYRL